MGIKSRRKLEALKNKETAGDDDKKEIVRFIDVGFVGLNLFGFEFIKVEGSTMIFDGDRFKLEGIHKWKSDIYGELTEIITHRGTQRTVTCPALGLYSRSFRRRGSMTMRDAQRYTTFGY